MKAKKANVAFTLILNYIGSKGPGAKLKMLTQHFVSVCPIYLTFFNVMNFVCISLKFFPFV